ncbi:DUF1385 domain-containing protein [Ornithinibacillus sp. FSL M8-0202]|uniref:DUF1385 domain-containing protein n=1 Tax=Ornithinibacillus sp. FSL M8-0202 TaxID=2921616 RepID=UPI0030CFB492
MEINGGRAGFNSVSFTGKKYQSVSRFKDKKITTETRLKKENKKLYVFISKLPFFRSFTMILDQINNKILLFFITIFFLKEFLIIGKSNSVLSQTIPVHPFVMIAIILVMASLIIKLSPVGRYHAAEHMAATAYEKNPNLTLEQVSKQPRIHNDCGTNLIITVLIIFLLLYMVFGSGIWGLLLSWSIGYEIRRAEPKIVWDVLLLIGNAAQYFLFTSKPKEKHLLVAIEAIKKLEEKEISIKN